jgi:sulfate transport system permease protein
MAFTIPPLQDIRPPRWVKPSFDGRQLRPALIPILACLYVGVVILVPALAVVVQAFAKGLGVFLDNFKSPELLAALRLTLLEGLSLRAAGLKLGISAMAVQRAQKKALAALRLQLMGGG